MGKGIPTHLTSGLIYNRQSLVNSDFVVAYSCALLYGDCREEQEQEKELSDSPETIECLGKAL